MVKVFPEPVWPYLEVSGDTVEVIVDNDWVNLNGGSSSHHLIFRGELLVSERVLVGANHPHLVIHLHICFSFSWENGYPLLICSLAKHSPG